MEPSTPSGRPIAAKELTDVIIRVGLIGFVVVMSMRIFTPFLAMMVWALILAVTLYPLHQKLVRWLGGNQGRAATLLIVSALLLLGVPTVMLGSSFAGQIHDIYTAFDSQSVTVRPPAPEVADWPLIGEKVHALWSTAAEDMPALLDRMQPQLANITRQVLAAAANTAGGVLTFLFALVAAGIMMAYGESGAAAMRRITCRLTGDEKGPKLFRLTTATVRSVAAGVIGVAVIQALLLGIGFILAGVPAAGILALVVLLVGILQLPALLVSLPVVAWLWMSGDASTTSNIIFTIYLLVAGAADNVLKPLLLGRGVDAPMPVILLGALGGMVSAGIIGLFIGAVILAVAYEIFMDWVNDADSSESGATGSPASD